MTKDVEELVRKYVADVNAQWKTGEATEHSYRPALKALLEGLLPKVTAINEPSRIACGAPDFILKDKKTALNLAFVEAKDIADNDLDGKSQHKEQFTRYKDSLESLCFTDYLDFRFYSHADFLDSVRIAEVKGDRIEAASDDALERFVFLLRQFADVQPQRIASPARLAQLMAGKARFLAQSVRAYLKDEAHAGSTLAQQMEAFRKVLIHDIDADSFADVFAQTVTYGMFAARLHDDTPEDFSRDEAAHLIPKTNPLLRQMFQYIAMDADDTVEWIVDDLVALFGAVDVEKLMSGYGKDTLRTDPLLHFYEDFLAAYDPKLRKARGVWYTPKPVVDFIVRAVDRILERDFGLPGGLADPAKVTVELKNDFKKTAHSPGKSIIHKDVHRVQILDPAAGTGTFLAETVKHIHGKVTASMGAGAWQGYVAENLLPRLNGFEILMASYAMAHLKLDMLLAETGYEHKTSERLRVFLTNSLEPFDKETGLLFAAALAQEANEANFIKRDCPVMVVMGNPPYSVSSANRGEWIQDEIAAYKKDLNEKKLNLDDDYIKFIRLGQHYVEKNGEGVLAYISNNSFIDGITHRQMRKSLLETFDEIYVLNLHGNARKKETAPDGGKDENVFDIMQGVSINIFVKRGDKVKVKGEGEQWNGSSSKGRNPSAVHLGSSPSPIATVHYADLYGLREGKYDFLNTHTLDTVEWKTLAMQEPYYFFVPKDFGLQEEYEKGFGVNQLFKLYNSGVQTKRDDLTVSFDEARVRKVAEDFRTLSDDELRKAYALKADGRDWTVAGARDDLAKNKPRITKYIYRPFDIRYTLYTGKSRGFMGYPRDSVMSLLHDGNLSLITSRLQTTFPFQHTFVAEDISDLNSISMQTGEQSYVFPLYLYEDNMGTVEKVANFDPVIFDKICSSLQTSKLPNIQTTKPSPESVFHYIYGVLHTPSYRERYKEFLKIDFPRIPYPKDGEEFRRVAEVGAKLVAVHLLKDAEVVNPFANPYAKFEGEGDGAVEKVAFDAGCVYINATQYFAPVPEEAWEFYIGGYQPAQKWLKDRKGRVLTADDLAHYKAIVAALVKTAALMKALE